MGVVLGRATDHRGAADIDVLDAILKARAGGDRRLKGVEVHRDQVDRGDGMRGHLRLVRRQVAPAEQAAMHLWHQRLDPAIEDFRKAGMV